MAEEKFGYETIEKIVYAGMKLGQEVANALADKKMSWTEAIGLIDNLIEIPGIINSGSSLKDELSDFSLDEKTKLVTDIASDFDISNDEAEQKIEASIDLAISAVRIVVVFRKKPAA